ncbi:MAG: ATP-binding cassette domain-containing protein [Eubacterium sp.]|nr:ATP-binding cassette domain-containing protein [Eubacterium sp.]MCI8919817.1 ATP-binding cassette domain-containing protein [Eubacterium sp.]
MEKVIEVSHLRKFYKDVQAVKDVSFFVERGGLFAFLGPNGAGKSTTINTICTFLKPDSGTVIVNGHLLGKEDDLIRRDIGTVFQENLLDDLLTVRENLMLRGGLYGLKGKKLAEAVDKAAKWSEVGDFLDRPYEKLSGGQRRRCDIARALLHMPKILFLDEPTTGLDPQTRQSIWNTVRRLQAQEKMTVFLTTHYMEEAEHADYVVVIDDGQIVAEGTPFSLKEAYTSDRLKLKCIHQEQAVRLLKNKEIPFREIADYIEIKGKTTKEFIPILQEMQDDILDYTVEKGSMNDVFLNITGKEIRQ